MIAIRCISAYPKILDFYLIILFSDCGKCTKVWKWKKILKIEIKMRMMNRAIWNEKKISNYISKELKEKNCEHCL